mgnify:CR=1 FL=1
MDVAHFHPGDQLVLIVAESSVDHWLDFGADGVDFGMIAEQKRRLQNARGRIDFADAVARQRCALQLAETDLAQHVGLVARDAAGVELDHEPSLALARQFLAPGVEGLHPGRSGGREGGEFEHIGVSCVGNRGSP